MPQPGGQQDPEHGRNREGDKEVLGFYLSENEGAKFWRGVLTTDLKNRGVNDLFIAYMDELTGFPDDVRAVFPYQAGCSCTVFT